MSVFDEFVQANSKHVARFEHGNLPIPPKRAVAVLTCMDARMHPGQFLGLEVGDAHVISNAGGRASDDAIRSLAISQRLLGTKEIVVIHHTDCGMMTFTNEQFAAKIKKDLDVDASAHDFLPFNDLEQSVHDDLAILRSSPLIPADIPIAGAIYDVHSGRLTEIARA